MSVDESQPPTPTPPNGLQFSLRTLLLLFVVLASSLGVFGTWGLLVFALVVGLAIYIHRGCPLVELAVVVVCLMILIALLLPAVQSARGSGRRVQCMNNLKEIALAIFNYEQENGHFPPAYIADKNGKPMHSWRLLILPYLESTPLYNACDLTQPWDGRKNKKLLATRADVFACPNEMNAGTAATQTSYVAVVGPQAAWAGEKPRKMGDLAGKMGNTIMVVEVTNSGIAWAEPRDLSLDSLGSATSSSPALTVSSNHSHQADTFFFIYDRHYGANVAMADGSVRYLPPGALTADNLRKILQVGGFREEDLASAGAYGSRRLNWPNIAALAVWLLSVGWLLTRAVRSRRALSPP